MEQINQSVENPKLVQAINDFIKEPSLAGEEEMMKAISEANYISPIKSIDGDTINFVVIQNAKGKLVFPAFTDIEELRKWSKENGNAIISKYEPLKNLLLTAKGITAIAINPYTQNIIITRQKIELIDKFLNKK